MESQEHKQLVAVCLIFGTRKLSTNGGWSWSYTRKPERDRKPGSFPTVCYFCIEQVTTHSQLGTTSGDKVGFVTIKVTLTFYFQLPNFSLSLFGIFQLQSDYKNSTCILNLMNIHIPFDGSHAYYELSFLDGFIMRGKTVQHLLERIMGSRSMQGKVLRTMEEEEEAIVIEFEHIVEKHRHRFLV